MEHETSQAVIDAAHANGKLGGQPRGTERDDKRTYSEDELIDQAADRVIAGKQSAFPIASRAGPITDEDRRMFVRTVGVPVEEFQARLTAKLQRIADKTADRVMEKLDENAHKPGELTLLLAVGIDKLAALGNRQATTGNQVGTQINIFANGASRADMLAVLKNVTPSVSATEVKA